MVKLITMVWNEDIPRFVEVRAEDYAVAVNTLRALVYEDEAARSIEADDDVSGEP